MIKWKLLVQFPKKHFNINKGNVKVFPNPFNSTTSISFNLTNPGNVVLSVYNLQGALVTYFVNSFQPVGEHIVEFNANGLPSGLYFIKMHVGDKIETGKMMIIK